MDNENLDNLLQGEAAKAGAVAPEPSAQGQDGLTVTETKVESLQVESESKPAEQLAGEDKVKHKDNAEASQLGRKVANMERAIEKFESLASKFDQFLSQKQDKVEPEIDVFAGKSDDDYLTVKEVKVAMDLRLQREKDNERKAQEQKNKAEAEYRNKFALKVYNLEPDSYDEVIAEINNSKQIYTGNPETDAEINLEIARAKLMVKKAGQSPEKKKSAIEQRVIPKTGTGFDIKSSVQPEVKLKRKLTPDEEILLKNFPGLSIAQINEALD